MSLINFNHLFGFYLVAKSGSLKSAAFELNVSVSTLSEQISNLEKVMGQKLFTRTGRTLTVNSQGRALFQKVETFFDGSANLLLEPDASVSAVRKLEIGVTTTISKVFAFDLLKPLMVDGSLAIRVTEGASDALLTDFRQGNLDILITHEKFSTSLVRRIKSQVVRTPRWFLVCGQGLSKGNTPLSQKFLSSRPFFLFSYRTPVRVCIDNFFRKHNFRPNVQFEVDDPELLKEAVLEDMGFSILPDHAIRDEIENGSIRCLKEIENSEIKIYAHHISENQDPTLATALKILTREKTEQAKDV